MRINGHIKTSVVRRLLIALLFLGSYATSQSQALQDDCDKVEVKLDVENTAPGQKTGKVKANLIKGDRNSVKFIFCKAEGDVLNENHFENDSLSGLAKGKYLCIVITSGCTKKISFTID